MDLYSVPVVPIGHPWSILRTKMACCHHSVLVLVRSSFQTNTKTKKKGFTDEQVILMGAFDLGISATLKKERTEIIIENHGMQQQHYLLHLFQSRAGMNGMRVLRLKTACAFTAWRPYPQKRPLFAHFSHNPEIHFSSVLPGQQFLQMRNPNGRT